MVAQAVDAADEDSRAPAWQWTVAVSPCVSGAFLPGSMGFGLWRAYCFLFIRRSKSNLVTAACPLRSDNAGV
jgi:hypothetical protein